MTIDELEQLDLSTTAKRIIFNQEAHRLFGKSFDMVYTPDYVNDFHPSWIGASVVETDTVPMIFDSSRIYWSFVTLLETGKDYEGKQSTYAAALTIATLRALEDA